MRARHRYLSSVAHPARRARRISQLSEARLPAALEVAAIRRLAEAEGGFAMVIRKGDSDRGVVLIAFQSRGQHVALVERTLHPDGEYRWQKVGPGAGAEPEQTREFLAKRVRFDPDLWLIELDVPDSQRFIAQLAALR